VQSSATQLDMVFNDNAGTWDNNGGQDWHFQVTGGQPPEEEWVMDGQLDAAATLIASNNGVPLYAGVIGDELYVATLDAGEGNDHFIFLANPPGALRGQPWAKAGQVAAWAAYIGNETDNMWAGWSDTAGTTHVTTGGGSGYLEGTINLSQEFGAFPPQVYLAVALYPTSNGSNLLYESQVPASVNNDGNVDAAEYALVDTCAVRADHAPADFNGDCAINWADFVILAQCLAGPGNGSAGGCPSGTDSDLDNDGDVDVLDCAAFQRVFGG
jgi:hypothetical protein